jgi:hypothetical protein
LLFRIENALDQIVGGAATIRDLKAEWDRANENFGVVETFDAEELQVRVVSRLAYTIYGKQPCVQMIVANLTNVPKPTYLALRISKDAVRLYFSDWDLWPVSENRIDFYPFVPVVEDAAVGPSDLEYEVGMSHLPRILRGKEAHEIAKHLARLLSATRLHIIDIAHVSCLSDPSQSIDSISFLRLIAGLPGLYEASGAVYASPEWANATMIRTIARR